MAFAAFFGFGLLPLLFAFVVFQVGAMAFRSINYGRGRQVRRFAVEDEVPYAPQRGGLRMENRVFRLAFRLGGRLTVSDLVVDTNLSTTEAEEFLDGLVDHSRVTMEVRDDGLVFYEFPEIIDRRGRGDDLPQRG
jgi:hypothetical protein